MSSYRIANFWDLNPVRDGRNNIFGNTFPSHRFAFGLPLLKKEAQGSFSPQYSRMRFYLFRHSNEDDITVVLSDIAMANTVIKAGLAKGTNTQTLMVQPSSLTKSVSLFWFDHSVSMGSSPNSGGQTNQQRVTRLNTRRCALIRLSSANPIIY